MSARCKAARLIAGCAVLGAVLTSGSARALPDAPELGAAKSLRFDVAADCSVVRAPFFTRNLPELQAHGVVLEVSASYALSERFALRAQIPTAAFSIRQPAGAYLDESVWGNPSLALAFAVPQLARALGAWTELGAGLPLAEQGPPSALEKNRALEAANAARGYLQPAAFTPAVVPVIARVGARFTESRFSAQAELSVPVLFRIRDPELPSEAKLHRVGALPSLTLAGSTPLFGPVSCSVSSSVADAAARVYEPRRVVSRLQPSLSVALRLQLGRRLQLSAAFFAPVAGALGGAVYTAGLSLNVLALP